MKIKYNRILPTVLSIMNISFWLCFRYRKNIFRTYPFTRILRHADFQFFTFVILGFTLCHAFYAFHPEKKNFGIKAAGMGILLWIYQALYNLLATPFAEKNIYRTDFIIILGGVLLGSAVFYLFNAISDRISSKQADDPALARKYIFDSISRYRNHLMGIAMLMIMLFHTTNMGARYGKFLTQSIKLLNSGVDIFVFLSGLGMIYSLTKNFNLKSFYYKRVSRIFPTYIPIVGAYTLLCIYLGKCGFFMLLTNCTGLSFWMTDHDCAFNWYIPGIMLFYLVAPAVFLLMKNPKKRSKNLALVSALTLLVIFIIGDFTGQVRLLVAFSRFPIFLLGMLTGFLIIEKKGLTKGEYCSLFLLLLINMFPLIVIKRYSLPVRGWNLFVYILPVFILSLYLGDLMKKLQLDASLPMRFLEWIGKNSLTIYLLNIVLVRVSNIYLWDYFRHHRLRCKAFCFVVILVNLLLPYLFERIHSRYKQRRTH